MENNSEATKDFSEFSQQETVETQDDVQTQSTQIQDESLLTEVDKEPSSERLTEAPQDGQEKEKKKTDKSKQLLFITEDRKSESNLGKVKSASGAAETEDIDVKKSKSNLGKVKSASGAAGTEATDVKKSKSNLGKMKSASGAAETEAIDVKKSKSNLGKVKSASGAAETEDIDVKKSKSNLGRARSSFIAAELGGADARKSKSSLGRLKSEELRRSRIWSRTKMVVGSVISITGQSVDRIVFERKGPRYMNTYKLWSDNPFNPEKVKKILELVMTEAFEELTYDPELCANKAKLASASIRQRVKELDFDRYKIICLVTIGERNSQDILVTARGLWDVERDRYAFFTIENNYLFGVAQCYGLYYE